jgi:hypothetical protein
MAKLNIDLSNVDIGPDSGSGFELIPEGTYVAKVIGSELSPTKSLNPQTKKPRGQVLELSWQLQSGPYERRIIWDKITLVHEEPRTQKIGREQWKKALRAAGIDHSPRDSSEIHEIPVKIRVKTKPASNGYEARSAVSAYYPAPQASPQQAAPQAKPPGMPQAKAQPQASPQPQQSAPPNNQPPWLR